MGNSYCQERDQTLIDTAKPRRTAKIKEYPGESDSGNTSPTQNSTIIAEAQNNNAYHRYGGSNSKYEGTGIIPYHSSSFSITHTSSIGVQTIFDDESLDIPKIKEKVSIYSQNISIKEKSSISTTQDFPILNNIQLKHFQINCILFCLKQNSLNKLQFILSLFKHKKYLLNNIKNNLIFFNNLFRLDNIKDPFNEGMIDDNKRFYIFANIDAENNDINIIKMQLLLELPRMKPNEIVKVCEYGFRIKKKRYLGNYQECLIKEKTINYLATHNIITNKKIVFVVGQILINQGKCKLRISPNQGFSRSFFV